MNNSECVGLEIADVEDYSCGPGVLGRRCEALFMKCDKGRKENI